VLQAFDFAAGLKRILQSEPWLDLYGKVGIDKKIMLD
jgi:hypothetical protein